MIMNTRHFAILSAMLAVPALVVSCDSQDYSTPEALCVGQISILNTYTKGIQDSSQGNSAPLISALKDVLKEQEKAAKAYAAMTDAQKKEYEKLISGGKYEKEAEKAYNELHKLINRKMNEVLSLEDLETVLPLAGQWDALFTACGKNLYTRTLSIDSIF